MSSIVTVALLVLLALVGLALVVMVLWLVVPFPRPFTSESDYSHHLTPFWELYYTQKYLRPKLLPERGAGLEEHFRAQTFELEPAPERAVLIRSVGDLMVRPDLAAAGGELWGEVGAHLFSADLSTGNLEFSVNEAWQIMRVFRFSVPPSWARPLLGDGKTGRFDYLSLANNHVNDSLSRGICRTREFLEAEGIATSGASRTLDERDGFPILERRGLRIALLAYTFSTNNVSLEPGFEFGVNLVRFNALRDEDYDDELIRHHVALARERGADYIVSNHHWCCDFEAYPPRRVVERTRRLFELGVDLIIGHHPHVVGPVERYDASDGRTCLAFYSLGSLTTVNMPFYWQRLSLVSEVALAAEEIGGGRRVRPVRVAVKPVFHLTRGRGAGRTHRLVPVVDALRRSEAGEPPRLTRAEVSALRRALALTRRIVGSRGLEIV